MSAPLTPEAFSAATQALAAAASITPSPTIPLGANPRDWIFGSSTEATTISAIVPYDTTPISSTQVLFAKIYVYAGLVFFATTVLLAIIWYIRMILVDGSFQDLPDDLRFDVGAISNSLLMIGSTCKRLTYDYVHLAVSDLQRDFMMATQNLPRRSGYPVLAYEDNPEWARVTEARVAMEDRMKTEQQRRSEHLVRKAARTKQFINDALAARKRASMKRISWAASMATLHMDEPLTDKELSQKAKEHQRRSSVTLVDRYSHGEEHPPKSILVTPSTPRPPQQRDSRGMYTPRRPSPLRYSRSSECINDENRRMEREEREDVHSTDRQGAETGEHLDIDDILRLPEMRGAGATVGDQNQRNAAPSPQPAVQSSNIPLEPQSTIPGGQPQEIDPFQDQQHSDQELDQASGVKDHDVAERGSVGTTCTCKDRKPFDNIDFLIMKGMCEVHRFR